MFCVRMWVACAISYSSGILVQTLILILYYNYIVVKRCVLCQFQNDVRHFDRNTFYIILMFYCITFTFLSVIEK